MTQGVVTPNMVAATSGLSVGAGRRRFGARPCRPSRRPPGQDRPADPVEAGDVDDGVQHRGCLCRRHRGGPARGEGADHELRDADRQRPHGRGADRRARRAAQAERRRRPPSRVGRAASSAAPRAAPATASPRSFRADRGAASEPAGADDLVARRCRAGTRGSPRHAGVDHQGRDARRLDPRLEIREFDALGVERTDDGNDLFDLPPSAPNTTIVSPVGRQRLAQSGTRRHVLDTWWIRMDRDRKFRDDGADAERRESCLCHPRPRHRLGRRPHRRRERRDAREPPERGRLGALPGGARPCRRHGAWPPRP